MTDDRVILDIFREIELLPSPSFLSMYTVIPGSHDLER